jgi:hypothetical protein
MKSGEALFAIAPRASLQRLPTHSSQPIEALLAFYAPLA